MIPLYTKGAALPDYPITWLDANGDLVDLSSGYTFELRLGDPGTSNALTKTTGITGAATAPNCTIAFDAGELDDLDTGVIHGDVIATRTADDKPRIIRIKLRLRDRIPAAA